MTKTETEIATTHAGYAALLGRPNVGKSTLLNRLIGQKISITAPKPQTTRHVILGIQTLPEAQIVYVDTPGLHRQTRRAMNRYLNRAAASVLSYVDVVVFLIEALRWTEEDEDVLQRLTGFAGPVVLAVNKVDRIADKARLLPFLREMADKRDFVEVVPLAAIKGDNVMALARVIARLLPVGPFLFPEDQITTVSERFLVAELIREKLTRLLREELPYALTVEIEQFAEEGRLVRIHAVIWVERQTQKGIVIGEGGTTLREVGRQAREDMERLLGRKVFLETWVKVREGWSDDERALRSLGYADPGAS
ncbi:GTPase Era [Candidatus Contendibacter odensensis]|uniref:GTPase Era n=1 Tax=Candidatus Contendobacter odensis Run_B_J11 TaxID=1400861 RepID=A0A7U7GBJ6_9GAMM|nr:GTPase Era [Candidatus Contendobacter odensis]MBK8753565.1 GTPase Era [Candidatus Competibacteraceae bacterium]CDH45242.1 GTPase believed to be involved in coordination of cell cycle, energy metabolism, cell division [Candidatus Contendobacter odensis Run_B_J11]